MTPVLSPGVPLEAGENPHLTVALPFPQRDDEQFSAPESDQPPGLATPAHQGPDNRIFTVFVSSLQLITSLRQH